MPVTMDGDQTIALAYTDLVAYTGGADPEADDPVAFYEDAISSGGTTGAVQAISDGLPTGDRMYRFDPFSQDGKKSVTVDLTDSGFGTM